MPRIITGTIKVQCSQYTSIETLRAGSAIALFDALHVSNADMSEYGYSHVGTAKVTITLNDPDTIVGDKVKSLQAEATKVQADAQAAVTRIQRQINELLAITNEVHHA